MAEQAGGDLILQVLDRLSGVEDRVGGVETRMARVEDRMDRFEDRMGRLEGEIRRFADRMDARFANQSEAMVLLASTIQQLTSTVKGRLDDHEGRLRKLESA